MVQQKKRLIFFDIDGTLITEGQNPYIPESTERALDELRKNGHICVINTGRPFASLDDMIRGIRVDGYICGCGTYIRLGEKILNAAHIAPELGGKILEEMDRCKIEWFLEGEHALYYADRPYRTRIGAAVESLKKRFIGRIHPVMPDQYEKISFDKFTMVADEYADLQAFQEQFRQELTIIDRGHQFFEVVPKPFSKATGMQYLEEYLGIAHENTIAVGDSTNDLPMLEYAAYSILMENADPALKEHVDYVTNAVTEDGIWNACIHLGLIEGK